MSRSKTPKPRWWITEPDGTRKLGPFESVELGIQVRIYVEAFENREDLSVEVER